MEWKPEYSVGIEEIDVQHRQLLRLFANIATLASDHKTGWADLHYAIVELKSFADFHFQFEEALQRLFGYADSALHHSEHQRFFERIAQVERTSLENDLKGEVLRFLVDWLTQHIQKSDQAYAGFILGGASVVRAGAG